MLRVLDELSRSLRADESSAISRFDEVLRLLRLLRRLQAMQPRSEGIPSDLAGLLGELAEFSVEGMLQDIEQHAEQCGRLAKLSERCLTTLMGSEE